MTRPRRRSRRKARTPRAGSASCAETPRPPRAGLDLTAACDPKHRSPARMNPVLASREQGRPPVGRHRRPQKPSEQLWRGIADRLACTPTSFLPARPLSPYPLTMSTRNRLRVLATIAVCLCAYMGWAATTAPSARKAKLHVDFLDVGHGDSTLITSPSGKTVLIDGGLAQASFRFCAARTRAPST